MPLAAPAPETSRHSPDAALVMVPLALRFHRWLAAAVAGPDDGLGAVGRAAARGVQALLVAAGVDGQLTCRRVGPLLVRPRQAVVDLHLRAVRLRLIRYVQASPRSDPSQRTGTAPAAVAVRSGGVDDLGGRGGDRARVERDVVTDHVAALAVHEPGDRGIGGVVPGQGDVAGEVAVLVVGVGPLAGGVAEDVAGGGEVSRPLVEVQAELPAGLAVVLGDGAVRVRRQRVDAPGVPQHFHDVADVVARDVDIGEGGGRLVDRLEVVEAAVEVLGAAALIVGAPAEPDVDAAVGHVGHVVVRDGDPGAVGGQDRGVVGVVQRRVVDAVVADHDVAVDHAGVGRVVRVGSDAADHDAAAGASR